MGSHEGGNTAPENGSLDASQIAPAWFPYGSRALFLGIKRLRKLCLNTVPGVGFLFGFHTSKGKTILPQTGKTGLPLDMEIIPTRQDISDNILILLSIRLFHIFIYLYFFQPTPFQTISVSKQYHA